MGMSIFSRPDYGKPDVRLPRVATRGRTPDARPFCGPDTAGRDCPTGEPPTRRAAMDAAIYFHPEAYTTTGPKLMGRNAAGESFLRGYLAYAKATRFWAVIQDPAHLRAFEATARAAGRAEPVTALTNATLGNLARPGTLYHPAPGLGEHAWRRAAYGHHAWSLCGITHTTASATAMDAIAELLTAPVAPWDALICTSSAVRENVGRVIHAQADHLAARLGIRRVVLPQLPVIPLGVHTRDFAFSGDQRQASRAALGVAPDDLVALFVGRLSFHAKAHPLAMYQALEKAAQGLPPGHGVTLVECGWHANAAIAAAFAEAAAAACPSVRVVTLDGRVPENRRTAWAGADVFCSLSDNVQETFGITPVEAMAAGLPVVVSDWDGYRDTVRHDEDGFRVPTLMPEAGLGGGLALRHALGVDTYDQYCGHLCMLTAVDTRATAQAFSRLFASPELRRRMGESGRRRAREVFDWSAIIPRYEALWAHLAELRAAKDQDGPKPPHPWPARMDPFSAFAGYPTGRLGPGTMLGPSGDDPGETTQRVAEFRKLAMVAYAEALFPTEEETRAILDRAASEPAPASELVGFAPQQRRAFLLRALPWLVKLGALTVRS
ncbi:glycosyltransferase [Desulfolutivibrio sulfoxidireducens]|nr:glycosyltransferase [Desulfolutivibrio sulfoxidireducens]